MAGRQRIDRVRRQYNQWVANQTLEDYALTFHRQERAPVVVRTRRQHRARRDLVSRA